MSNPYYPRRSLFGPLLLIGLGVVLLLRHMIPAIPLAAWIAQYWPVLLILWGLSRLIEYFRSTPGQARVGLSGGEVFLLLLIIFFGLSFSATWRYRNHIFGSDWGVGMGDWDPFQHSYHFDASASAALPAGKTVVVQSPWGDVQVLASSDGKVHADLDDVVRAEDENRARSRFQSHQPAIQTTGDRVLVLPAGPQADDQVRCDLKLSVPAGTPVIVQTRRGDLTVSNWQADLTLATGRGSVTADHIKGNVQVTVHHDSTSLDHIAGNVSIQGGGDDVTLSNIDGVVSLQGEYSGDLSFQHLAHGITFTSSRTDLRLGALNGTVDADMGDMSIVDASDIRLRTRDKDIEVHRFTGPVDITNQHDSVTLTTDTAPAQPISVNTSGGDIELRMPAASQFSLHASARRGSINTDFGASVQENDSLAVADTRGNGPMIHLETSDGTISLRKSQSGSTAPQAGKPSQPSHATVAM